MIIMDCYLSLLIIILEYEKSRNTIRQTIIIVNNVYRIIYRILIVKIMHLDERSFLVVFNFWFTFPNTRIMSLGYVAQSSYFNFRSGRNSKFETVTQ